MENNNAKGYSIAALVCGILGIVGSFIPWVCYFTFVLAILGIVFGVKGRKLAQPDQKGLATAGFVLGIIGTAIALWALSASFAPPVWPVLWEPVC